MSGAIFFILILILLSVIVLLYTLIGNKIGVERLINTDLFHGYKSGNELIIILTLFILISLIVSSYFFNLPLKLLIVITLLNLLFRENYPFTHYPMYSSFSRFSNFIYIADEKDEPIPMKKIFGIKSNFLKKIYMEEIEKLSSKKGIEVREFKNTDFKMAGDVALNYLIENCVTSPVVQQYRSIKLYDTIIFLNEGKIQKDKRFITEKIFR